VLADSWGAGDRRPGAGQAASGGRTPRGFQQAHSTTTPLSVAYFSMGVHAERSPAESTREDLAMWPDDQLKASSDLGCAIVAVGLLYQQGYFRQVIDKDGAQQALFP